MHNAPAVAYPVGRSRFHRQILLVLLGVNLLVLMAWHGHMGRPPAWWAAAVLFLFCMASAWYGWVRSVRGQLRWDGTQWRLHVRHLEELGRPLVRLDLQRILVLQFRGQTGSPARWLCLESGDDPAQWDALRRALFSLPADSTGAGDSPM